MTRQVAPKVDRVAKVPSGALAAVGGGLLAVTTAGTGATAFAGFPMAEHPIAGKTGTADLPPNAPFAWFASYAPAGNPRWAVVVMVEQGGHGCRE